MAFCFQANVSQTEYERAHREYLKRAQLSHNGQEFRVRQDFHVFRASGKTDADFAKLAITVAWVYVVSVEKKKKKNEKEKTFDYSRE